MGIKWKRERERRRGREGGREGHGRGAGKVENFSFESIFLATLEKKWQKFLTHLLCWMLLPSQTHLLPTANPCGCTENIPFLFSSSVSLLLLPSLFLKKTVGEKLFKITKPPKRILRSHYLQPMAQASIFFSVIKHKCFIR